MREIKFRGKRKDTKKWVCGYLFKTPLTVENFKAGFIDGPERLCISDEVGIVYEIIEGTECQYTGMHDKNKKEIYEGVYVARGLETYRVVWSVGGARFIIDSNKHKYGLTDFMCDELEVLE